MDDFGTYYYGAPKFVCGRTACTVRPAPLPPFAPSAPLVASPYATVVPAGWVEVGYLVSVPPPPHHRHDGERGDHYDDDVSAGVLFCGNHQRRPRAPYARAPRRNSVVRASSSLGAPSRRRYAARAQAHHECRRCGGGARDDDDGDRESDEYAYDDSDARRRWRRRRPRPPPPPAVRCVSRRYRLFARGANACRPFASAHYYQYAASEEGVAGAILVRLSDDPRVDSTCALAPPFAGSGAQCHRYQELYSGDLVRVPGDSAVFRVQLYADDARYA